jgi:flagellar protein FliO/FliZ
MKLSVFAQPAALRRWARAASLLFCSALMASMAWAADPTAAPAANTVASAPAASTAAASTTAVSTNAASPTISTATPAPASAGVLGADAGSGLLRSVMGLAIVLALIAGLAWLGRRFGNKLGSSKPGLIKTVAALAVGQRENVVIVELGEQWLVLGVAPGRVNTLAQMPRQELPAAEMKAGAKAFAHLLARASREGKQ